MYISNMLREDGFGAQFQSILWTLLTAEGQGLPFVYTPIEEMAHNYENDPTFLGRMEDLMGFRKYFPLADTVEGSDIVRPQWPDFYKPIERNMEFYHTLPVFEQYKSAFLKQNISPYTNEHFHIAIHIRRPNTHDPPDDQRGDTPNQYYLQCIAFLRKALKDCNKPLQFHVYSQGTKDMFSEFDSSDTILHLNGPPDTGFLGLVYADALVTSKSSYSYIAALLTNGTVFYTPFWHPPRANWLVLA